MADLQYLISENGQRTDFGFSYYSDGSFMQGFEGYDDNIPVKAYVLVNKSDWSGSSSAIIRVVFLTDSATKYYWGSNSNPHDLLRDINTYSEEYDVYWRVDKANVPRYNQGSAVVNVVENLANMSSEDMFIYVMENGGSPTPTVYINRLTVTLNYPEPGEDLAVNISTIESDNGSVTASIINWTEKVSGDPATTAEEGVNYVATIPVTSVGENLPFAERVKVVYKSAIEDNTTSVLVAAFQHDDDDSDALFGYIRITFSKTGVLDPYINISDESNDGGGLGKGKRPTDDVVPPVVLNPSAIATGFITVFNPSLSRVAALAAFMWNADVTTIEFWKKVVANPIDLIIGLQYVPVSPTVSGASSVTIGMVDTQISMNKVSNQFVKVPCGSLTVEEKWGSYLDYSPYTRIEIYLPYCGIHPLNTDDVMNKVVSVEYEVDVVSGDCIATLSANGTVLYTFAGNCASAIPVTSQQFGNLLQAGITLAASVGSMVASGGLTAPLAGKALTAAAGTVAATKPSISRSGSIGGTAGMMAPQKPYLIITSPEQAVPGRQNAYTGYPSFITSQLSELQGYTEIEAAHMAIEGATDPEYSEITSLLKEGVIL